MTFLLFLLNLGLLLKTRILKALFLGSIKFLDFDNYHRSLNDILAGQHPYKLPYMQTLGPPLVYLFFLPFAFFKITQARKIITFLNLSAVYLSSFFLAKKFFKKGKLWLTLFLSLVFLSSFPARFNIFMGQPNLFLSLLVTFFLFSPNAKVKGLSLALMTVTKTYFGFAFLSLFKPKNRKTLFYFLLFFILLVISSFIIIKPVFYLDYFKKNFTRIAFKPTNPQSLDYYNQSLKSTMYRLGLAQFYLPVYLLFLLAAGLWLIFSGDLQSGIILSLLVSPVCWQYYFAVLFPVIVSLFMKVRKRPKFLLIFIFAFFLWWQQHPGLHSGEVNLLNGFLASHQFFSALIFLWLRIKLIREEKRK